MTQQSITNLERFACALGGHLRHYGATVKVSMIRDDTWGGQFGGSCIEMRVEKLCAFDRHKERTFRFVANGYENSRGVDKSWGGSYFLRDVKRFICNTFDIGSPRRYKGTPIEEVETL